MNKIIKSTSLSVFGVLLSAGFVSAQTGSIDTTGPDSENEIVYESSMQYDVENTTDIQADVELDQDASSGDAEVRHNTEAGDAETGDAENMNEIEASIEIDNSGSSSLGSADMGGCGCGGDAESSIDRTGPDSTNTISTTHESTVEISNEVDIDFDVDVEQDAESGDATVQGNTIGGSATTGSASNHSSTVFSFSVQN